MDIDLKIGQVGSEVNSTIIIGVFKDTDLDNPGYSFLTSELREYLKGILALDDFKAGNDEVVTLYPQGLLPISRIILIGLGESETLNTEVIRCASGLAIKEVIKNGIMEVWAAIPGTGLSCIEPQDYAQASIEGMLLGGYSYELYKTTSEVKSKLKRITLVSGEKLHSDGILKGLQLGQITAEGTMTARDLSNAPGNGMPPQMLAAVARKMAAGNGLKCKILARGEIEKEGMGALIAVNAGSAEPPRFIILEYGDDLDRGDAIVIVGKGITFDSGGISIKPSGGMEEMKHDMSGAAAVIGAMQAISQLKPSIRVVGLIPATENLPDGKALKPGDIITALAGKTIEVINTDAEGRLVLADALGYAKRYEPAAVIDLATLTGACVIALGNMASGMMGNNKPLQDRVQKASEVAGERVWPLPIWKEHHDQIKSNVADVKNTGGRWGGALTAGAFLEKFVSYPWVHLDIAGTAYTESKQAYCPIGATGVGVRLLVELIRRWEK